MCDQKSVSQTRSPFIARLWLTGVALGQVLLTPIAAFSITYLFSFQSTDEGFSINFESQMIPWIVSASIAYGMLALSLALIFGGFSPIWITENGGLAKAIRLSRGRKSAHLVELARIRHRKSPHGKMMRMVNDRLEQGHGLLAIHGGLVLLAIPFQLFLVIVPLLMMLLLPENWIHDNRLLEWALVCYLVILTMVMRIFPTYARRYVAVAAFTRRWLISITRLSWMAPILVLWMLGRLASLVVVTWLGPELAVSIAAEKAIFEDWLGIGSVPENSFLDLLTALAVMPLAAFTTLSVLGGGSGDLPTWMKMDKHEDWQPPEGEEQETEEQEQVVVDQEEEKGLLEEVIPLGAAAILPGTMGVTLSDSLDTIPNSNKSEDLDDGPPKQFEQL